MKVKERRSYGRRVRDEMERLCYFLWCVLCCYYSVKKPLVRDIVTGGVDGAQRRKGGAEPIPIHGR